MTRHSRPGGPYVRPVTAAGVDAADAGGRGLYTLAANTTYYYVLGTEDAPITGVTFTGYTAGMVVTSLNVQTSSHGKDEVADTSSTSGEWITQNPPAAYVPVDGTGWSASAATVAAAGTGVGGCSIDMSESGSRRTRIKVVVGSTGGNARLSTGGKS